MKSMMGTFLSALAVGALVAGPVLAQEVAPALTETVKRIMDSQPLQGGSRRASNDHDRWIGEVIKITEIPAPPFKEQERCQGLHGVAQGPWPDRR